MRKSVINRIAIIIEPCRPSGPHPFLHLDVCPAHRANGRLDVSRCIVSIREPQLYHPGHFLKRRPAVGGAPFVPLVGQRRKQLHGAHHPVARDQRQAVSNAEAVEQRDIKVGVPAYPVFPPHDLP